MVSSFSFKTYCFVCALILFVQGPSLIDSSLSAPVVSNVRWSSAYPNGCPLSGGVSENNQLGQAVFYSFQFDFTSHSLTSGSVSFVITNPYYTAENVVVTGVSCSCVGTASSFFGNNMSALNVSCSATAAVSMICSLHVTITAPPSSTISTDVDAFALKGCVSGTQCTPVSTCNTDRTVTLNQPVVSTIPYTSNGSPIVGTSGVGISGGTLNCLEDTDLISLELAGGIGSRGGSLSFPSSFSSSCLTDSIVGSDHVLTPLAANPICPGESCLVDFSYSFDPVCSSDPSANADFTKITIPLTLPANTIPAANSSSIQVFRNNGLVSWSFLRNVDQVITSFSCSPSASSVVTGDSVTLNYVITFNSSCSSDTGLLDFNTAGVSPSAFSTPSFSADCSSSSTYVSLPAQGSTITCVVTFNLNVEGSYNFQMTATRLNSTHEKSSTCSISALSPSPTISASPQVSNSAQVSGSTASASASASPSQKASKSATKKKTPTRTKTPCKTVTKHHGGGDGGGDGGDDDHHHISIRPVSASNSLTFSSVCLVAMLCSLFILAHYPM